MMDKVNALALELTEATLEYYRVKLHCDAAGDSVLREDAAALRDTWNNLCMVQTRFAWACEEQAKTE
jgi:hypothetical protein